MSGVLVGTSGWVYPTWRGTYYPPGLAQSKWLAHYAAEFPTVEVNSTFYRLAKPAVTARWAALGARRLPLRRQGQPLPHAHPPAA